MALHDSSSPLEVARGSAVPSTARPRHVVWVQGEQDVATTPELSEALARAIAGDPHLVVDLSLVEFMDASTLGVIVGARRFVRERSGELTVRAPSHSARRVLDICGLADLIGSDELEPDGPTSALGTWVQVPATDGGAVAPLPEPGGSRRQAQRPPPVPSRPGP